MKRWLVLAIVGVMLAVPAASATTWQRSGYDPGRTGAIPFEGPQTNDTAFEVELAGTPFGETVVVGDHAYTATVDGGLREDLDEDALWRIHLDTGRSERVFNTSEDFLPEQLTPNLLIGEDQSTSELVAFEIPSGEERWRLRPLLPGSTTSDTALYYDGHLTVDGTLYAGYLDGYVGQVAGVMAVDLETGSIDWSWNRTSRTQQEQGVGLTDALGGPDRRVNQIQIASDGDRIYPYMRLGYARQSLGNSEAGVEVRNDGRTEFEVWGVDTADGTPIWVRNDTRPGASIKTPAANAGEVPTIFGGGMPAVADDQVYIRLDQFLALNAATGETIWPSEAGRSDHVGHQGTTTMGVRDDAFIGTSRETLYRLDAADGDLAWQRSEVDAPKAYNLVPTVIDEDTAYVSTWRLFDDEPLGVGIDAHDLETGERLWQWSYNATVGPSNNFFDRPAYGPGFVIWGAKDGTVHVIGQTEASLGEPDVDTERYPAPGEQVTIEVPEPEPGAFGEATRYRVDWGDGTVTGWQESRTFTHTYNETGEHEAQVYAGNDANQTASTFVTMNVGAEEPSWVGDQFQHHQDRTYGILGLAVAVTGGAIGVARRYRERSRLQEELEALEDGFEDTRGNVGECEAFLETRKARARSLVLDGVLTEEQFGVIESRIGELRSQLRTELLDERLQFLPHGMVQSLKGMLADGEISTWEQDTFERLLEEDETLNEAQRETVRGLLERWSESSSDRGGQA